MDSRGTQKAQRDILLPLVASIGFLIFIAFCVGYKIRPPIVQAETMKDMPASVIELAQANYVPVYSYEGGVCQRCASGIRLDPSLVLTVFHATEPGMSTFVESTSVAHKTIVGLSTKNDLLLIAAPALLPRPENTIPLARTVTPGEILVSVSNESCRNGILKYYWVAKDEGDVIYVEGFERRMPIPGESGSGLLNAKGELVGIVLDTAGGIASFRVIRKIMPITNAVPAH